MKRFELVGVTTTRISLRAVKSVRRLVTGIALLSSVAFVGAIGTPQAKADSLPFPYYPKTDIDGAIIPDVDPYGGDHIPGVGPTDWVDSQEGDSGGGGGVTGGSGGTGPEWDSGSLKPKWSGFLEDTASHERYEFRAGVNLSF